MKATPQSIDVSSGFRVVTLLVEDLTPFLALGKPLTLTISAAADDTAPAANNITQLELGTAPGATDAKAEVAKIEENLNSPAPTPCTICKGSGVVAEFVGDQKTGQDAVCSHCKGTGVEPAPATSN